MKTESLRPDVHYHDQSMLCRHGSCRNPAPDYRLVDGAGYRSWRICSTCASALRELGAWIIPVSTSIRPVPSGAAESPNDDGESPIGGPAGVRTDAAVR